MTRQAKTPRQRAEEALAVEQRRVERLTEQWNKARAETDRLSRERDAAILRRDHLATHPDLPQQDQTGTTPSSTSTGDPA